MACTLWTNIPLFHFLKSDHGGEFAPIPDPFFLKVWLDPFPLKMYIPTNNPRDEDIDIDSLDGGETVWPFSSFVTL